MTDKRKLVMATNNAGKLREARAIVGDRIEILSLKDIGFDGDIEETADTLEGNALIKVRAIKEATGLDCFADDTGLLVDALDGAPGVHTARYAGEQCDPDANIDLMLKNMEGVTDRRARFRTCVALSLDGEERLFEGTVEGSIATGRSGSHGFGYDPVFIPEETGICFAEMADEDKNAISHRGRAVSAMMKWISTLCVSVLALFQMHAATASSDWVLYNTFDDKIENVFDTPDKTYFLAHAQLYNPAYGDNSEKLMFLFCLEKKTGEIRQYNSQNFLSQSLVTNASYNARKNYLFMVYQDGTIDILDDDGTLHSIHALKSYSPNGTKGVRSISFDPDMNKVYLATDFGFIVIDDKKYEVSSSAIYNVPVDHVLRVADRLVLLYDGKIYQDNLDSSHISLSDFKEVDWGGEGKAVDLMPLTAEKCLLSRDDGNKSLYYLVSFEKGYDSPEVDDIGNISNSYVSENKDGILFARYDLISHVKRNENRVETFVRREEDRNLVCGSWDMKDYYYVKPREGIYSVRRGDDNTWTLTSQPAKPNSPAVFRSTNLLYSPRHGMLVNTHGETQNFTAQNAPNPILLSALKDQTWTMYGLPYLDPDMPIRLNNPCGIAQDPDNPDLFYFGSVRNGLLRYDIKDPSSLLHMTMSSDNPTLDGHVSLQDPYSYWGNVFMLFDPRFDSKGNLIVAHTNTNNKDYTKYTQELWIWPAEKRRATVSPETFQPFVRITLDGLKASKLASAMPLKAAGAQDMVVFITNSAYQGPFAVYDHNGTPEATSDDRMVIMKSLKDSDGSVAYNYIYCMAEDPQTGLVWVGSDNGVFTFDPKEAFSNPGEVSRIKVSRNDGTSLADYLLAGIPVNDIHIDPSGRKWFSLNEGGIVCTAPDGKTILQEINSDNSLLPSDLVYATCYNPDNNSLMIATSAGLCEYFLNGQSNESGASEARAYPNPVRHDYYGWVTIDGLEEDCIVKIADSAGNIVRELGPASAGRVQWDVCGMDFNRVPSGVYFVMASSGPAGGSYSEVTKILVINR